MQQLVEQGVDCIDDDIDFGHHVDDGHILHDHHDGGAEAQGLAVGPEQELQQALTARAK